MAVTRLSSSRSEKGVSSGKKKGKGKEKSAGKKKMKASETKKKTKTPGLLKRIMTPKHDRTRPSREEREEAKKEKREKKRRSKDSPLNAGTLSPQALLKMKQALIQNATDDGGEKENECNSSARTSLAKQFTWSAADSSTAVVVWI